MIYGLLDIWLLLAYGLLFEGNASLFPDQIGVNCAPNK